MRAILAGAALAAFVVTPTLADHYIVQEPTTKRCRIVEERPAPGVGVIIGGVGLAFAPKLKAECEQNAEKLPEPVAIPLSFRSVNVRWNVDNRLVVGTGSQGGSDEVLSCRGCSRCSRNLHIGIS